MLRGTTYVHDRPQAASCAHCPITVGDRSNLLGLTAGSGGLLTGEVRGRSFTRAYTSRSLSAHPDKPTIPLIAFLND